MGFVQIFVKMPETIILVCKPRKPTWPHWLTSGTRRNKMVVVGQGCLRSVIELKRVLGLPIPKEKCSPSHRITDDIRCEATVQASNCAIVHSNATSNMNGIAKVAWGGTVDYETQYNSWLSIWRGTVEVGQTLQASFQKIQRMTNECGCNSCKEPSNSVD